MHAFRADFADHVAANRVHEAGIEPIAATHQKRLRRHRGQDAPARLVAVRRGVRQTRVGQRHVRQRQREHRHPAAIHSDTELFRRHARPGGDRVVRRPLHRMRGVLVTTRRFPEQDRPCQHRRVLARTVVVEACEPGTRLAKQPRTARRQRFMRTTGQIPFFEADAGQHRLREGDVLRFTAVRRTGQGQLARPPPEALQTSGAHQRHYLKRLGAGAPPRRDMRIPHAFQ